jgi:CLIP-associating protein 1/2
MATLDATQARLLENAPDNPNSPKKVETVAARPGLGFSKSTTGPPKPSLRETMLAQKKAVLANKNIPARPGSAMSSFSPMRTVSTSSNASASSTASEIGPVRPRPESTTVAHGGLSVAPMRPTKFRPAPRPELTARPATAGPYSVRRPGHGPTNSDGTSPSTSRMVKARTPSASSTSPPKRPTTRPNTSHSSHTSQSSHASPVRSTISRVAASPRASPAKPKSSYSTFTSSSPTKADEDFTMVVPTLTGLKGPHPQSVPQTIESSDEDEIVTPLKSMKVYEDPFSSTDDQTTPRPAITAPVLEEVAVNEDASNLVRNGMSSMNGAETAKTAPISPERMKQNSRLLDSGITKIKAKSLDVHGFRKLQGMIKDNKAAWSDDRFDVLLLGLFEYLEAPLTSLSPEKIQDVKAQILATIKLMYKKDRDAFRPHVPKGLESLLITRSCYDARAHTVSGLELLANELVTLADPKQITDKITSQLQNEQMTLEGGRTLSMGLHVLKELVDAKKEFVPNEDEVKEMCKLAARCLESSESGVRMDAVQLCVSVHSRVGDARFWDALGGVKDDPKNLITYYIVKKQRELAASG